MTETPLRQARKRRGLSVREVAESVGTDPSNMSRLETGHHAPPPELARTIYQFYQGDLDIVDIYDPTFNDEIGIIKKSGNHWYTITTRLREYTAHGIDALPEVMTRVLKDARQRQH